MSTREKAKVAGASLKGAKKKLSEEEACLRPTRLSGKVSDKKVPRDVTCSLDRAEADRQDWKRFRLQRLTIPQKVNQTS